MWGKNPEEMMLRKPQEARVSKKNSSNCQMIRGYPWEHSKSPMIGMSRFRRVVGREPHCSNSVRAKHSQWSRVLLDSFLKWIVCKGLERVMEAAEGSVFSTCLY
jgi:hypothetical protein